MAAKACDIKKAQEIKLIKIDKVSYISEWILIAEGLSDVQVDQLLILSRRNLEKKPISNQLEKKALVKQNGHSLIMVT